MAFNHQTQLFGALCCVFWRNPVHEEQELFALVACEQVRIALLVVQQTYDFLQNQVSAHFTTRIRQVLKVVHADHRHMDKCAPAAGADKLACRTV